MKIKLKFLFAFVIAIAFFNIFADVKVNSIAYGSHTNKCKLKPEYMGDKPIGCGNKELHGTEFCLLKAGNHLCENNQDPAPNEPKMLSVIYECIPQENIRYYATARVGSALFLDCHKGDSRGKHHARLLNYRNQPKADKSQLFHIKIESWGDAYQGTSYFGAFVRLGGACFKKDVVKRLEDQCNGKTICNINITNDNVCGGDPAPNVRKTLEVKYHCETSDGVWQFKTPNHLIARGGLTDRWRQLGFAKNWEGKQLTLDCTSKEDEWYEIPPL